MSKPKSSSDVRIAPMLSFAGSAERLWGLTQRWYLRYTLIVLLVLLVWVLVAAYYIVVLGFLGVLFFPWRIIRRGNRKRRLDQMRHEELLAAMQKDTPGPA